MRPVSSLLLQMRCRGERLTFNDNLCHRLNHAQATDGNTGVVGWFPYALQLQNVPADWHRVFRGQVLWVEHPFDIRHRRPHCHARDVDTASWHDLMAGGRYGEARGYTANCRRNRIDKHKEVTKMWNKHRLYTHSIATELRYTEMYAQRCLLSNISECIFLALLGDYHFNCQKLHRNLT